MGHGERAGGVQGVGLSAMNAGAQPVIGLSDTYTQPGTYSLEIPCPRRCPRPCACPPRHPSLLYAPRGTRAAAALCTSMRTSPHALVMQLQPCSLRESAARSYIHDGSCFEACSSFNQSRTHVSLVRAACGPDINDGIVLSTPVILVRAALVQKAAISSILFTSETMLCRYVIPNHCP